MGAQPERAATLAVSPGASSSNLIADGLIAAMHGVEASLILHQLTNERKTDPATPGLFTVAGCPTTRSRSSSHGGARPWHHFARDPRGEAAPPSLDLLRGAPNTMQW